MPAETPGEFRPKPAVVVLGEAAATGDKVQPPETLPISRAPASGGSVLPEAMPVTVNPEPARGELLLRADWKLVEAKRVAVGGQTLSDLNFQPVDWHRAIVPGTVLGSLVADGTYPDPYYGLNNLRIPESLNKQDYWYRTEFVVPKDWKQRDFELEFQGVNYYAEAWLNGHYLGHITGAFIRGNFEVTPWVKREGTNVLAVMIVPPPDPGNPSEQSVKYGPGDNGGRLCLDGPTFVCAEGWDWIPAIRDRCSGIWQDVVLRATGPVKLGDVQVVTKLPLPDTNSAEVEINAELRNAGSTVQKGVLTGTFEGVKVKREVEMGAGETKTVWFRADDFPQLKISHPRLWWPNGYGKPELYQLKLTFRLADGLESDQSTTKFGIREMSYELAAKTARGNVERVEYRPTVAKSEANAVMDANRKELGWNPHDYKVIPAAIHAGSENSPALSPVADDQMGPFLVVKVNGVKIECLGGNWGMDDALKRIPRERLEPYVRLHRDANLNMIRNWSGQNTSEVFYELCDEYGILVWNDFWMDTETWNYPPADHGLFLRNVADTIKRYRNHPSIALWCAMNEGIPPDEINDGNARLIRELDGTRYYQPNSRLVNLRSSGPWSNEPLDKYFTELNHGFSTELGASSIPSAEVMRSIMPAEDLWPPGDVWAYHDFHSKGAGSRDAILGIIAKRYGAARDLDDLCRKAQMVNYETYRAMYEGFNSRLWKDCSGVLVWMSHPSWPSVVWQFYSWDYDPNAAYFGAKVAAEPVHVQLNLANKEVEIINRQTVVLADATVREQIFDLAGTRQFDKTVKANAGANVCTPVEKLDLLTNGVSLVKLELIDRNGKKLSENFYWLARADEELQKLNDLPEVALVGEAKVYRAKTGATTEVTLRNRTPTPALAIRLTLREAQTGRRILPAYYSDNYLSLMPGESRTITIEGSGAGMPPQVDISGWNIKPISLTESGVGLKLSARW